MFVILNKVSFYTFVFEIRAAANNRLIDRFSHFSINNISWFLKREDLLLFFVLYDSEVFGL